MATLHISEADILRNPQTLLTHLRAGSEVIIEDGSEVIARAIPQVVEAPPASADPEYDAWFLAQVQEGLDCDPSTDVDGEIVEAQFAQRRRDALLKLQSTGR